MNYLNIIESGIERSLSQKVNFTVDIPELEHGDVTSNFCLVAAKVMGKSPKQVFDEVYSKLIKYTSNEVERIEFKNPGFVNFYFKKSFIQRKLNPTVAWWNLWNVDKVTSEKYTGKNILVEHTSVNLFKPFTLGHLMTNFTGEFVGRVIKEIGGKVTTLSYPSDKSIGIAKAIWSIKKDGGITYELKDKTTEELVKYFGASYVSGVNSYKQAEETGDEKVIREVKDISNNIFNETKGQDLEIFEFAKKKNLEYFEKFLEKLNSKFENFIFESEAGIDGKRIVMENVGKVFEKSEGAIIYKPAEERKDINISVFINGEGNPTYLAKDIGLLDLKFKKYNPDYSIYVVDNEQNVHFRTLFDAAGKINKQWEEKSVHVQHGRMTFKGQKMSSRLGGVPNGEEVVQAVYEDVVERSDEKIKDLGEEEKKKIQLEIALAALRISILRSKPGVNIDFDPERASSFEGDSGPYLCYTHARCCSLLEKAKVAPSFKVNTNEQATNIERKVLQYSSVLRTTADELAPQKLVKYLFELAGEFNSFYANNKITEDAFNLYLTKLVKDTLQKGLYILGINAPSKM